MFLQGLGKGNKKSEIGLVSIQSCPGESEAIFSRCDFSVHIPTESFLYSEK